MNNVNNLIVIGCSAGGPRALYELFSTLQRKDCCILVVMHLPEYITQSMATLITKKSNYHCIVPKNNQPLENGFIFLAPGEKHIEINSLKQFVISDEAPIQYVKPNIDKAMLSIQHYQFLNLTGVILSGMGKDGVKGVNHFHKIGAKLYSQNQKSASIYGMPKFAAETNLMHFILSAEEIGKQIDQNTFVKKSAS